LPEQLPENCRYTFTIISQISQVYCIPQSHPSQSHTPALSLLLIASRQAPPVSEYNQPGQPRLTVLTGRTAITIPAGHSFPGRSRRPPLTKPAGRMFSEHLCQLLRSANSVHSIPGTLFPFHPAPCTIQLCPLPREAERSCCSSPACSLKNPDPGQSVYHSARDRDSVFSFSILLCESLHACA